MIVSVERRGEQLALVTTFNAASGGNAIERNIRNHPFPISVNTIIGGLKAERKALGLAGAKVYFRLDNQVYFGTGVSI